MIIKKPSDRIFSAKIYGREIGEFLSESKS